MNDVVRVKGCVTQEKYLKGRTIQEIEKILGFQAGRLTAGATIAALQQVPETDQFELAGYTQVATHRFDKDKALAKLEENKLKQMLRTNVFAVNGPGRLVKVIPVTPHDTLLDENIQYPPGLGVPQWKLTTLVWAKVVAKIKANEKYS